MAQGIVKKSNAKAATRRPNANSTGLKKGQREIAPKKATLLKQKKMAKKFSAGMIGKTERTLAARAGHLELLKGGKKDKDTKKEIDPNVSKKM